MALTPSGRISMGGDEPDRSINVELGKNPTDLITLNDADARELAGVPSGIISLSDFYGKSSLPGENYDLLIERFPASLGTTYRYGYSKGEPAGDLNPKFLDGFEITNLYEVYYYVTPKDTETHHTMVFLLANAGSEAGRTVNIYINNGQFVVSQPLIESDGHAYFYDFQYTDSALFDYFVANQNQTIQTRIEII